MARRRTHLIAAALTSVAVATSASAAVAPSSASAATSFSGAVTYNGNRIAGATVTVFRYDNAWVRTSVRTTTDASGRYTVGGLSNWRHYQLEAYRSANYCSPLGYFQTFRGYSQVAYAEGGARGANIAMGFEGNWSCY